MPEQLNDPLYQIMVAQGNNIARIAEGLILEGTDGQGTQRELWGPRPDIIRLYDSPLRMNEDAALDAWQRIVTINPVNARGIARIVNRNDRSFMYQVQFLVRLTEREISADRTAKQGLQLDAPLAVKAHKLLHDWHNVFFDDLHLETADCPQGLVDDAEYEVAWEPGAIQWPNVLFSVLVSGTRGGW